MSQIHRIGLGVAVVATVLTVAGALVVDGYATAGKDVARATATQQSPTPTIEPTPSLEPLTVYVKPAPLPPVTHVTKPAPVVTPKPVPPVTAPPVTAPPAPDPTPPVIHVIVPTPSGEDGRTDD